MENYQREYKREYKKGMNDSLIKTIIAFLNTSGGKVYIGIADDESVKGIPQNKLDEIVRTLHDLITVRIHEYNPDEIKINKLNCENKWIIEVKINKGNNVPYYDKKKGMVPEGVFYRENGKSVSMPLRKIQSLYQKMYPKDISKIVADNQKLKIKSLKIYLEDQNIEWTKMTMSNMGLLNDNYEKTYMYQLLADSNSTSIKFNYYNGKDKLSLVESTQLGEIPLFETARHILGKLKYLNGTETIVTDERRLEYSKLDPLAIREMVINAIVHNDYMLGMPQIDWYSDRIEIISHGGLPYGMTIEEFHAGKSKPRNQKLVNIFNKLEFVESIGLGMERIKRAYEVDIFEITDNYFKVVIPFYTHKTKKNKLKPFTLEDRIMDLIYEDKQISTMEISNELELPIELVKRYLKAIDSKTS